jgi:hypothetical protein
MAQQTLASNLIINPRIGRLLKRLCAILATGVVFSGAFALSNSVCAQTRDHLTDEESELVRFYQELDKRMDVFLKAVDRRFAIINGTQLAPSKKLVKDEPDWGDPPKGTRAELLGDIAGILDEAITNIDDVNRRDEKNPLISRALRKLTTAANGYMNQLTALKSKLTTPDEVAALERVADNAKQIIEVGNKLPPPEPEDNKKKKKP